ncbi:hypothetical protein JCM17823_24650 [Halorubrum gandharaense]
MASPSKAIRRVRQARREESPPRTKDFDSFRPEYRAVLTAIRELGGDPAIDEVTDWMVERVHETGHLPTPAETRDRTRAVANNRGLSIPENSPLRTGSAK